MFKGAHIQHEQLESRTLLSVTYAGRVLSVYGTAGNDVIAVALKNGRVAVFENGVQTASFATVRSILVEGGSGRDKVGIDSSLTVPSKLTGGSGHDTLSGGGGPDVLYGNTGNDLLLGQAGADALLGGAENDTLDGGDGNDYLEGADGLDTVTYANRKTGINATLTWDDGPSDEEIFPHYVTGRGGATGERDSYYNVDTLIGTAFDDSLTATNYVYYASELARYPLLIEALDGNDTLFTGASQFIGDNFVPTLNGGNGDDRFGFGDGGHYGCAAEMFGQGGNDTLEVIGGTSEGIAYFDGGTGNDTQLIDADPSEPQSHAYSDRLADGIEHVDYRGNTGGRLYLTDRDDSITLFIGSEHYGADGPALEVIADDGHDRIEVLGDGRVSLNGGDGRDTLLGGTRDDTLNGGADDDTISYATRTTPVKASIIHYRDEAAGGGGGAEGENDTYISVENLIGGRGNDTLSGGHANFVRSAGTPPAGEPVNYFFGLLRGGPGNDTFEFLGDFEHFRAYGESGDDTFKIGRVSETEFGTILGGDGTDTQIVDVQHPWTWSVYERNLAAEVENALIVRGVGYFAGNELNNRIVVQDTSITEVSGGWGNDWITTAGNPSAAQTIWGGDGIDRIEAGSLGTASMYGGKGNDVLVGAQFNDTLFGDSGNDALFGKAGNDSLDGGEGSDYLEGNEGIDTLVGALGNDSFYTRDRVADFIYGGDGSDTLKGDATEGVVDSVEVIL